MRDDAIITINCRDFTASQWASLVRPRAGEPPTLHASRVAGALGVGCVTSVVARTAEDRAAIKYLLDAGTLVPGDEKPHRPIS